MNEVLGFIGMIAYCTFGVALANAVYEPDERGYLPWVCVAAAWPIYLLYQLMRAIIRTLPWGTWDA